MYFRLENKESHKSQEIGNLIRDYNRSKREEAESQPLNLYVEDEKCNLLAGWFPFHWIFYLQLIIEFAIVYLIIWAILYKREAKKVDHINQLLEHKK